MIVWQNQLQLRNTTLPTMPDRRWLAARSDNCLSNKQDWQVLETKLMKIIYDQETDTLTVIFAETFVAESDEDKPGVILDYDASGNLVSLEILDASHRVEMPGRIEYEVAPVPA
jgi:uncharacterized protein YuzE